jgi:hypothetical protein
MSDALARRRSLAGTAVSVPEFEAEYRQRIADAILDLMPESTPRALAVLDLVRDRVLAAKRARTAGLH